MTLCKLCGCELERIGNHLVRKHGIDSLEYFTVHIAPDYDICNRYVSGRSASQICVEIKERSAQTINPIKKQLLAYLRSKGVHIRTTSEATECWIKETGGVWNKGLTKETHQSVQRYANSRMGKANPYFKTDPSKRFDTYYSRIPQEQVKEIQHRAGQNLKAKYRTGSLIHWSKSDPAKALVAQKKIKENWERRIANGIPTNRSFYQTSAMERKLGSFLADLGEKFEAQKSLGYHNYDYILTERKVVLEYNGSYWHCDPRLYPSDYWHSRKKQHAWQIWEKDAKKKRIAENKGYFYLAIWEDDLQRMTDEQIKQYLVDTIKNCFNSPSTP